MQKVAALVVTYNRLDLLKESLNAVLNQTRKPDAVYVVDNASTDGTYEYLKGIEGLKVIRMDENVGGAGGFKAGMKRIICDGGFDWIWLMDDDAVPFRNALQTLIEFYESLPEKERRRIGVLQNKRVQDREWFLKNDGKRFPLRAKPRHFGTFVGYFVKTKVVERVGFPREEFFIYADDVEYTFRIKKMGFKVLTVDGSYIYHPAWATPLDYVFRKRVMIKRGIIRISPWRNYYVFRNPFLMFDNNPLMKWLILPYYLLDALDWRTIDRASYEFAIKGIKDGLARVGGRVVEPGQKKP